MIISNKSYTDITNDIENIVRDHTLIDPERLMILYNEILKVDSLVGDYAELGVYKGGSSKLILNYSTTGLLHMFDTFSGMPQDDIYENGHKQGHFYSNLNEVKEYINNDRAVYHVGKFPDTSVDNLIFKYVHIDADIYQSTVDAIKYFWPRLITGGVLIFDDLDWQSCPGVRQALYENFNDQIIHTYVPHQGVIYKK